jgi:hypothetical protein
MPTVIVTDNPIEAERLTDPKASSLLVTHHAGIPPEILALVASARPSYLRQLADRPFEWSGYDEDGRRKLIVVSASWTWRDLHEYGIERWETLTELEQRMGLTREQRRRNGSAGGTGRALKARDAVGKRRDEILKRHREFVLDGTPPHEIVGKIVKRMNISRTTVANHLKKAKGSLR